MLDEWGRETLLLFFLTGHWRKPIDFSDDTLAQAKAQVESFRNVFRSPSEPAGDWAAFEAALDDDFNTPEALALMHDWRDHGLLRRGLDVFGLASLAGAGAGAGGGRRARRATAGCAGGEGLRRGRPAARRDRGRRLGRTRRRRRLPARPDVSREQVYGRRPVREALRGPREVLELWATERAVKSEAWLREPSGRASRSSSTVT